MQKHYTAASLFLLPLVAVSTEALAQVDSFPNPIAVQVDLNQAFLRDQFIAANGDTTYEIAVYYRARLTSSYPRGTDNELEAIYVLDNPASGGQHAAGSAIRNNMKWYEVDYLSPGVTDDRTDSIRYTVIGQPLARIETCVEYINDRPVTSTGGRERCAAAQMLLEVSWPDDTGGGDDGGDTGGGDDGGDTGGGDDGGDTGGGDDGGDTGGGDDGGDTGGGDDGGDTGGGDDGGDTGGGDDGGDTGGGDDGGDTGGGDDGGDTGGGDDGGDTGGGDDGSDTGGSNPEIPQDTTSGISDLFSPNTPGNLEFQLAPNPAYGHTTLRAELPVVQLEIYSFEGRRLSGESVQRQRVVRFEAPVQAGIYLVLAQFEDGRVAQRKLLVR